MTKIKHLGFLVVYVLLSAAPFLVAAYLLAFAPKAHADIFTICPSGRTGVVGGATSCPFADNVREGYFAQGQPSRVLAYSPVTGDAYWMDCIGPINAHFTSGQTVSAMQCYGGVGAEVVLW